MALDGAARMADVVGQAAEATTYQARMAEFKTAFLAKFWNGTELRTPGRTGGTDERGHGSPPLPGCSVRQRRREPFNTSLLVPSARISTSIWRTIHPVRRRCSSVTYVKYVPS
jgi:hypothetical protein